MRAVVTRSSASLASDTDAGTTAAAAPEVSEVTTTPAVVTVLTTPQRPRAKGKRKLIQNQSPAVKEEAKSKATDCPICYEPCTKVGTHRLAALTCGHLFGKNCIDRWVQTHQKCPTCNTTAQMRDIHVLFSEHVAVVDNSQVDDFKAKYEEERTKRLELESELTNKKRRINESLMKAWQAEGGKGKEGKEQEKKKEVIAEDNVYLNNRFNENDQVKVLGARFDGVKKKWYIPSGRNIVPFKKWLPKQMAVGPEQIAKENIYIYCPIRHKNEAKALGARFDGVKQQWFIPKGEDMTKFDKWRTPPTYIYCPITEKDQAKRLGAEWDPIKRQWYVPPGQDLSKFAKWRNPRYIQSMQIMNMLFPGFEDD